LVWIAKSQKGTRIVTMGDAAAAFLECPEKTRVFDEHADETREPQNMFIKRGAFASKKGEMAIRNARWAPASSTSWFRAVSLRRWLMSYIL